MIDHPVLGQVVLGYSPMIDRHRTISALRLTLFPTRPEALPDAADLVAALAEVWPEDAGRISLDVGGEPLLERMMRVALPRNMMLETPAFMAADPAHALVLVALFKQGNSLLIKGRPLSPLPPETLNCFSYSIIDLSDERRLADGNAPPGVTRSIAHVQSGVRTIADMETSFARGAEAVLGWPIDDAVVTSGTAGAGGKQVAAPGMQVIMELIHRVDKEEPIEKLENTLKRDPLLAFKLLRYINSPAFGLRVEISSFRHAIMMLGYKRLKRWLALLLATASKDVNLKPVMFAAVRRGLLMEELARSSADEEMRSEVFICGVFSLLDRMFQQPFEDLLATIPVPERVRQALIDKSGPYQPYMDVVLAAESESLFDFRDAAERLMMGVAEINRAQLRALMTASELE